VADGMAFGISVTVAWRDVDMLSMRIIVYLAYCEDLRSEYQEYIGLRRSGHGCTSQVVVSIRAGIGLPWPSETRYS